MMEIFTWILVLLFSFLLPASVESQDDQSGFISIDCGVPENYNYSDPDTGMFYTSDSGFVDSGSTQTISHSFIYESYSPQFDTLRSFPEGKRNCYTLKPAQGKGHRYLIRASFLYGNYDGKDLPPIFDIHLGGDYWETINITSAKEVTFMEIIHEASSDYIYVCLVKTLEQYTPFISVLELRLLNDSMYKLPDKSLVLFDRFNVDRIVAPQVRYKDDVYDRLWQSYTQIGFSTEGRVVRTNLTVDTTNETFTHPPPKVMSSGGRPDNISSSETMTFVWKPSITKTRDTFYVFMYFAELEELQSNQLREFNIYVNGVFLYGPFVPEYLKAKAIYNKIPIKSRLQNVVTLRITGNSSLPPLINAIEVYMPTQISENATNNIDVAAIRNIKSTYGLTRNWQGDPCMPEALLWEGLNCSHGGSNATRITSLKLSSSDLNGIISSYISNLTALQTLDLSNNNLTGEVPEFLAELPSLKVLNLKGNIFSGPYPTKLLQKSNTGQLLLSIDEPKISHVDSPLPNGAVMIRDVITIVASLCTTLLIAYGNIQESV